MIIEALVIALVFRTFLYQPFSIPTASMQSTLMIGDYFVASKFAWGLGKYSFPIPLPFNGRILAIASRSRGDIAVFHNEPTNEDYIKRVIGLPGDKHPDESRAASISTARNSIASRSAPAPTLTATRRPSR